jgi:hypothetical protein
MTSTEGCSNASSINSSRRTEQLAPHANTGIRWLTEFLHQPLPNFDQFTRAGEADLSGHVAADDDDRPRYVMNAVLAD